MSRLGKDSDPLLQHPDPEKSEELDLIADLQVVFDAIAQKIASNPNYDLWSVDSSIPDPHGFNKKPYELLEIYLQMAIANAEILKNEGGARGVLQAMKATKGVIEDAETILDAYISRKPDQTTVSKAVQQKTTAKEQQRPKTASNKMEQTFNKLGIGFDTETAQELVQFDHEIEQMAVLLKTIGNQDYDPRNIVHGFNLLQHAQYLQARILSIRSEIDVPTNKARTTDPSGFFSALSRYDFAFTESIGYLVSVFQEKVDEKTIQTEKMRVVADETKNPTTESLKISELIGLKSEAQVGKIRQLLNLNKDESLVENESLLKNRNQIKEIVQKLNNTIEPAKSELENDIEERDIIFEFVKAKLVEKGQTKKINLDEKLSAENLIILRTIFQDNQIVLDKLVRAEELSVIISKKTVIIDSLNIVLQWAFNLRGESKIESVENAKEVVKAIYNELRTKAIPANKDFILPEFDKLFEMSAKEAYDLLAIAVVQRIENFYGDQLSSSNTAFQFHKGSVDLWSNDKMFKIAMHEADDLGSFQFFFENFPWDNFLDSSKQTEANMIDFKAYAKDLWKFRILAIQNAGNAAAGVENLWRGNEHGSYKDEVFNHIASKGNGGGNQSWDMGPYHKRTHRNRLNNGENLFRETFGEVENEWLVPEYENFFIYQIEQHFSNFCYNFSNDHAKLKEALGPDGFIYKKLTDLIEQKFGKDRIQKDAAKIDLARKKAIWTIVHTLKLHEFDKGAVHVKLSRYMAKTYMSKIFATGVSGVRWRPNLAVSVERAFVPMETFMRLDLKLTAPDGTKIYDELTSFDYKSTNKAYTTWLLDLKLKSVDQFSYITKASQIEDLIETQSELSKTAIAESQQQNALQRIATLEEKVVKWTNYYSGEGKPTKEARKLRLEDIKEMNRLQVRIDHRNKLNELNELIPILQKARASSGPSASEEEKTLAVKRAATTYAINKRYKVVYIKSEHTGLGNKERLPIAIPRQYFEVVDGKEIAHNIPLQAVRDSQLQTSDYVDFSTFPANSNQSYFGFAGEAKRWFEMLDYKQDAVFAPIRSKDVQEKATAIVPVFEEKDRLTTMLIKTRIVAINMAKALRGYDNVDVDESALDDDIDVSQLGQISDKIAAVFKHPVFSKLKRRNEVSQEEADDLVFTTGIALDEHLRSRVNVRKIPLDELRSESDEKDQNPAGLGFPDIVQYAAKYLYGKSPDKHLILEMFREKIAEIEEIIRQEALNPPQVQPENFLHRTLTPVPFELRRAVDLWLDSNQQNERAKTPIEKKIAKSTGTRAENEVIVSLFWLAIDAYLDQYAFDKNVGESMPIPLNKDQRARLIDSVDTVSGVTPMDFIDRQLFIAYVNAMLRYFASSGFAIGGARPSNIGRVADVVDMMIQKGIIGSEQQINTDLHSFEGSRYSGLVQKTSDKK